MRFPYDTSYRDSRKLLRYGSDWAAYGVLLALLIAAPWIFQFSEHTAATVVPMLASRFIDSDVYKDGEEAALERDHTILGRFFRWAGHRFDAHLRQ